MSTEPEHLPAPDPDRPEEVFRDGTELYEVDVWPATFPAKGFRGNPTASDLGEALVVVLFVIIVGRIGLLFDRRWKVVVSRRRADRRSPWVVVHVEFHGSADLAEEKRVSMLRDWRAGQFSTSFPISASELRRARRESKRA